MSHPILLSGDIGGTKTRLALLEQAPEGLRPLAEHTYASTAHPDLDAILGLFLSRHPARLSAVGLGIAGPVQDRRCAATNLPWTIDADQLERGALALPRVRLVNDLEATAWGIAALRAGDLHRLQAGGPDPLGNRAVIAAGTGLGQAGICWDGQGWHPFASEGGHTDFAPTDELEWALAQFLADRFGHVSWERLVSGPGILNIHEFLCQHRQRPPPAALAAQLARGEGAAVIAEQADLGDPICIQTLDLFCYLYGREAGNHALKVMATGGVYLGGGIAPKLLERLMRSRFLAGFFAKGRMESLLRRMPVQVIRDDRVALFGAAAAALALPKKTGATGAPA